MNLSHQSSLKLIFLLVLLATISRLSIPPLLGHIPNFSVLDATAILCGAYLRRRTVAIGMTLFITWTSDLLINYYLTGTWTFFYSGFYWQYAAYVLMTLLSATLIHRVTPIRVVTVSLLSSYIFFLISNFGVWYEGILYAHTLDGLVICYVAALPFFKNTLFSDLFFTGILFGTIQWLHQYNLITKITADMPKMTKGVKLPPMT